MKDFLTQHQNLLDFISSTLTSRNQTLSLAESCTGGFLSSCFTSKSGASQYFKGSMVVYHDDLKTKFLNVKKDSIEEFGIASDFVVRLMAKQIRIQYNSDFGFATTGYVDYSDDVVDLYAWISVASEQNIYSECVFLNKSRLENIQIVSYSLLSLFRKEFL